MGDLIQRKPKRSFAVVDQSSLEGMRERRITQRQWRLLLLLCLFILSACSDGVGTGDNRSPAPVPDGGAGTPADGSGNGGGSSSSGGGTSGGDPNDRDGDGMPAVWESDHGLNDLDASDAILDSDNDYLQNLREYQMGLDPQVADSDGDGLPDGVEVDIASDPLQLNSVKVARVCSNACDYTLISAALAAGEKYVEVLPGTYSDNVTIGQQRHVFSAAGAGTTMIVSALDDHVVTMAANSSLHGFTLSGGSANLGGGIYASPVAVIIRANIIYGNQALFDPLTVNSGYGGGVYIYSQGSSSTPTRIEDNEIHHNSAAWGAAAVISDYSYAVLVGNRIHDNLASNSSTNGSILNQALGGGVFLSEYAYAYCINNVFYANQALDGKGGGIYAGFNNAVMNNTVVNNMAAAGSGVSATALLIGNIIWNNQPVEQSIDAVLQMHYSIVNGGFSDGVGNLGEDPQFVGGGSNDYQLLKTSPAIDTGSRAACDATNPVTRCIDAAVLQQAIDNHIHINRDAAGRDRGLDGDAQGAITTDLSDYDIGAYEYRPLTP